MFFFLLRLSVCLGSPEIGFVCVLQSSMENQMLDERDKAQRLQTELDVSEAVQKDFVKLSQNLQVSPAPACPHPDPFLCRHTATTGEP